MSSDMILRSILFPFYRVHYCVDRRTRHRSCRWAQCPSVLQRNQIHSNAASMTRIVNAFTNRKIMTEDEEQEMESFVTRSLSRIDGYDSSKENKHRLRKRGWINGSTTCNNFVLFTLTALTVLASFAIILLARKTRLSSLLVTSKLHNNPYFQCPAVPMLASENKNDEFTDRKNYLDQEDAKFTVENADYFLKTFRDHKFDGWNENFNDNKEKMRETKKQFFVPNIKSGDHIYESACGLGLNLYATLEILQEEANITGITVHGNEYLAQNAEKGNKILNFLTQEQGLELPNHIGSVCQGDSTNLSFVPSNTYDLVFTGWITPLLDPLNIGKGLLQNTRVALGMCRSATEQQNDDDDSWKDKILMELGQERQDNWYGGWVKEMIRIAKPGAPVIVEEVAHPLCDGGSSDYGGVAPSFWTQKGPKEFGWDIDPKSVKTLTGGRVEGNRYHVFMRKKDVEDRHLA